MKHLLLVCCSFIVAANSYGASPTLEQLIAAGTIWNTESADGTSNYCREHIRFSDASQSITAREIADNEDYRPGDMAFYMENVSYDEQGRPRGYIISKRIPYRPNASTGRSTLRDESGFVLGFPGSSATINNKPDRIILVQKGTVMGGSYTNRITFHKESGRIEIYSNATGSPAKRCSYLVSEPARQPSSVVESDRAVPRGDTSSSDTVRTPGADASTR
jgi:hypothetical protein